MLTGPERLHVDLTTLRLFVAACEERSIARAARRERIAVSALSKRLSDFEISLNLALFHRRRSGIEPTEPAFAVLKHARKLLQGLEEMEEEIGEHRSGLRGTIRIHSNLWAILQCLPEDLASFFAQHPLVCVEVEENTSPETVEAVAHDNADIGIIGNNVPAPQLRTLPYRSDRLVGVLRVGHELAGRDKVRIADLLPYGLIGSTRGSSLDDLVQRALTDLDDLPRLRMRVTGYESICRMIEAGIGVGVVPESCVQRYRAAMRIESVPLDEPWVDRKLSLCVRRDATLPMPVQLLLNHLSLPPPSPSAMATCAKTTMSAEKSELP